MMKSDIFLRLGRLEHYTLSAGITEGLNIWIWQLLRNIANLCLIISHLLYDILKKLIRFLVLFLLLKLLFSNQGLIFSACTSVFYQEQILSNALVILLQQNCGYCRIHITVFYITLEDNIHFLNRVVVPLVAMSQILANPN